jgi:hypothetical protein
LPRLREASSRPIGIQISVSTLGNANPSGITPMTLTWVASTRMRLPMISGSPPNPRRHRPLLSTTAPGSPGRSSSREKVRPMAGDTPRVSKNRPVTYAAGTRTGSTPPVTGAPPSCHAPKVSYDFECSTSSTYSGPEIQKRV